MHNTFTLCIDESLDAALKQRSETIWKTDQNDLVYMHYKTKAQRSFPATILLEGRFFEVAGNDVSSCASIAAFIGKLFSGPKEARPTKCVYCCWAPMSKLEVRIVAREEGPLKAFSLNQWAQCAEVSQELWKEIEEASAVRFMKLRLENTQLPNHLVLFDNDKVKNVFCNVFLDAKSRKIATAFRLKYSSNEECIEMASLQTTDQATLLQHQAQKVLQIDLELALKAAQAAIKLNPLDSQSWFLAIRALIGQKEWKSALTLMNNCPREADEPRPFVSLPLIIARKGNRNYCSNCSSPVDVLLQPIAQRKFNGNLEQLYELLCEIHKAIGWESLLEARSTAFVMESEGCTDEESFSSALSTATKEGDSSPLQAWLIGGRDVCEGWLDELFMILYEEIKIWYISMAEMQAFKDRGLSYSKNAREWEIIGGLAFRLGFIEYSIDAYQNSLEQNFSHAVARALAKIYQREDRLMHFLVLVAKIFEFFDEHYKDPILQPEADWTIEIIGKWGIEAVRRAVGSLAMGPEGTAAFARIFCFGSGRKLEGFDR